MQADRRDTTAPRRRYEALVEVGSESLGGFEAEAVDVSLDGIRLRTAYMPEPGERLRCRFDGYGGEILAEGEVIWTEREGRGGELGLRFTGLDRRGIKLLEELCGPPEEVPEDDEPSVPSAAPPGAKVRLHIQGLGSPMRARVRDTARGEVLVGSNLEFLRVGRPIELEDVERSRSRSALIEHVTVDIDPETKVPQLVVALSYGDQPEEDDLTTAPVRVRREKVRVAPERRGDEITPEPTVIDKDETPAMAEVASAEPPRVAARRVAKSPAPPRERDVPEEAEAQPGYEAEGDELAEEEPAPGAVAERAAGFALAARAFARKMGPQLSRAGDGAKSAFGRLVGAVKDKADARREDRARRGPKRTTAPAPGGGLKTDGKRVFRKQHASREEAEKAPPPPRKDKRRAMVSAVLGAGAVFAIYMVSSHVSGGDDLAADPALAASAPAGAPEVPGGAPAALPGGVPGAPPIATANVPLYGATPLSTIEAVPVPPMPGEAAEAAEAEAAPEPADVAANLDLTKEWGVGEVENPIVLRLKMDGTIAGISGKETNTGFTITVPGRKSNSPVDGLSRRDKRLDAVNVVNYPDRAEITLRFKGEVPPFVAKVTGKAIVIELGTPPKKAKKKKK